MGIIIICGGIFVGILTGLLIAAFGGWIAKKKENWNEKDNA